jgi:uncharacterized protein DUF3606
MSGHIENKQTMDVVRLTDDYKVKYWCRRYNLSIVVLKQVILKVGENVKDIEKHLRSL